MGERCNVFSVFGVGGGVGRNLTVVRGVLLTSIAREVGGDVVDDEPEGDDPDEDALLLEPPSFGAIAIGTASTLLYAGYPSHCLPDRTHFWHCGRVSSHFTLRFLQLLHPVLTFGRLALLAFSALADLALPKSAMMKLFRPYALLASHPSLALFVLGIKLRSESGS